MYIIVCIKNQGFGRMTRDAYEQIPQEVLPCVDLVCVCETEHWAQFVLDRLPREWVDATIAWWGDAERSEPSDLAALLAEVRIEVDGEPLEGELVVIQEG